MGTKFNQAANKWMNKAGDAFSKWFGNKGSQLVPSGPSGMVPYGQGGTPPIVPYFNPFKNPFALPPGGGDFNKSSAQIKLNDIRNQMPNNNLKYRGNMALADVDIKGLPNEFISHSKIHNSTSKGADVANFSYTPESPSLETYIIDKYPRYNDTEAKILEDIAAQINDPNASGIVNLYTELPACQSCSNLILEFREKYPNIELNIFTK